MKKMILFFSAMLMSSVSFAEGRSVLYSEWFKSQPKHVQEALSDDQVVVTTPEKAEEIVGNRHELRLDSTGYQSNVPTGDGGQLLVLYKSRVSQKWTVIAIMEGMSRYDLKDGRVGGGAIYHMDKKAVRVEITEAGRNTLFPSRTAEAEYVTPLTDKLVGYAAFRYSDYQQADVVNYLASLAAEYYVSGKDMLYLRVFLSRDDFASAKDAGSVTGMIKYVRFITDDNRVWVYYANSVEHYAHSYDSGVGQLKGNTYGIGGSYKISKNWYVETNLEYQDRRNSDTKNYVVMFSIIRRW